jgi:hypothetical protein
MVVHGIAIVIGVVFAKAFFPNHVQIIFKKVTKT